MVAQRNYILPSRGNTNLMTPLLVSVSMGSISTLSNCHATRARVTPHAYHTVVECVRDVQCTCVENWKPPAFARTHEPALVPHLNRARTRV